MGIDQLNSNLVLSSKPESKPIIDTRLTEDNVKNLFEILTTNRSRHDPQVVKDFLSSRVSFNEKD